MSNVFDLKIPPQISYDPPIKSKHSYHLSRFQIYSWIMTKINGWPHLFHSNLKCNSSCRKCDKNTALFFCLWNEKALRPFPMVGAVKSHWIFFSKVKRRLLSLSVPTTATHPTKYPVIPLKLGLFKLKALLLMKGKHGRHNVLIPLQEKHISHIWWSHMCSMQQE